MKSREICIPYNEFNGSENPGPGVTDLIEQAKLAAGKAYAPFSHFHVGVAVELANGLVYTANNQENSAYPSGLCAERVGLFYAQANHPDIAIKRMVLVAKQHEVFTAEPVFPCGACRQVMVESAKRQETPFEIWMVGQNRILQVASPDHLLPLKFIF